MTSREARPVAREGSPKQPQDVLQPFVTSHPFDFQPARELAVVSAASSSPVLWGAFGRRLERDRNRLLGTIPHRHESIVGCASCVQGSVVSECMCVCVCRMVEWPSLQPSVAHLDPKGSLGPLGCTWEANTCTRVAGGDVQEARQATRSRMCVCVRVRWWCSRQLVAMAMMVVKVARGMVTMEW